MKTKNILRAFFAAIFVLGATAIYAQSNVATEDNLLLNPGFENPSVLPDGVANLDNVMDDWKSADGTWFDNYYGLSGTKVGTITSNRRGDLSANTNPFFSDGQNGFSIKAVLTGNFAGRLPGGENGGTYQVIDVTPGATYEYGCDIAVKPVNANQYIKGTEGVKILTAEGEDLPEGLVGQFISLDDVDTTTYAVHQIITHLSGNVTIPDGINQVRFQIDQRNLTAAEGGNAPVIIFDECFFKLKAGSGFKTPQSKTSIFVSLDPTKTNLTVSGVTKGVEINVLTLQGTLLKSIPAQENSTNIDVSSLPQGFYLLQAGGQALKFIKQ